MLSHRLYDAGYIIGLLFSCYVSNLFTIKIRCKDTALFAFLQGQYRHLSEKTKVPHSPIMNNR